MALVTCCNRRHVVRIHNALGARSTGQRKMLPTDRSCRCESVPRSSTDCCRPKCNGWGRHVYSSVCPSSPYHKVHASSENPGAFQEPALEDYAEYAVWLSPKPFQTASPNRLFWQLFLSASCRFVCYVITDYPLNYFNLLTRTPQKTNKRITYFINCILDFVVCS